MSISFSGITSGLDTSSWIESLVALRRAKITTLQTQKNELLAAQDTLNNIKSFFNNFRTTIQKITDTKFGTTSFFGRNTVTSSNLGVLSATVNDLAQAATYQIKVNQLATNTKAESGFKEDVYIDQLATMDTKLSALGINTGTIKITKGDITRSFVIQSDDNIRSLINKFNGVGVDASYDVNTGIFSVDIDEGDISDVGRTGIINALGLENANKGYQSKDLVFYNTIKTTATEDTLLKDIDGIDIDGTDNLGGKIVGTNFKGEIFTIEVDEETTINDLCGKLSDKGVDATFSDGRISIWRSNILSENIGLMDALHLNTIQQGSTEATTKNLYVEKFADLSTTFADLGMTSEAQLRVKVNSNYSTLTFNPTDTIKDLFDNLKSVSVGSQTYNIEGTIENGVIELNTGTDNVTFSGGVAEILGLDDGTYSTIGVTTESTEPITYDKIANKFTTLSELGYDDEYTINIYKRYSNQNGGSGSKLHATITVNGSTTLDGLFDKLDNYGIQASIDEEDGKISIEEQVGATIFVASTQNNILSSLGITSTGTFATTKTTVGTTKTSITGVTITLAEIETTTEDCLLSSKCKVGTEIKYKVQSGTAIMPNYKTFTVTETNTFGDLADHINQSCPDGIACLFLGGSFGIYNIDENGEVLGGSASYSIFCSSSDSNSKAILKDTHLGGKKLLDYGTTFDELGFRGNNLSVIYNGEKKDISIAQDDTVAEVFIELLDKYGITSSISEDGKLTISGNEKAYLKPDNAFNNCFNISGDHYSTIKNLKETYTSPDALVVTKTLSQETTLEDLGLRYSDGFIIQKGATTTTHTFATTETMGTIIDTLDGYGITAKIEGGKFIVEPGEDAYVFGTSRTMSTALKISNFTNRVLTSSNTFNTDYTEMYYRINDLKDENGKSLGIVGGEIAVYDGNTKEFSTINIANTVTLKNLTALLAGSGIDTTLSADGKIKFSSDVGSYMTTSGIDARQKSNLLEKLEINNWLPLYEYSTSSDNTINANHTETILADGSTRLTDIDSYFNGTTITGTLDNDNFSIEIKNTDTIEDVLNKFRSLGLDATINQEGTITIADGEKELSISDWSGLDEFGFTLNDNFGGYLKSGSGIYETIVTEKNVSAANSVNANTKMSLLGITDGTLTLYKNGEANTFDIKADETFRDLQRRFDENFGRRVQICYDDGCLKIQANDGSTISIGSGTSNFASITGLEYFDDRTIVGSKKLYNVNLDSVIVSEGIFEKGKVTEGSFMVGDQVITIDANTTIRDVIDQINTSEQSNATARWDANNAKLILESRSTGSGYIYVGATETGGSNITDILGFTKDGSLVRENQEQGKLAEYYIGDQFKKAQTNVLDSALTGIAGVTINLKGLSKNGEYTTLTIEKDKEIVANAVSDMVDSYNTLVENIDKELAKGSDSRIASTLKLLKNQIRSYMTGVHANDGNYNSMYDIGISTKSATAGNISTNGISGIVFDKEKFMQAYSADSESVQKLLVGTDANKGVFWQLEEIVNKTVGSTNGYFSSTTSSYDKQISRLDDRIQKAEKDISVYRQRLENKFNAMELLITKMQDQYSSFLNTGFMM